MIYLTISLTQIPNKTGKKMKRLTSTRSLTARIVSKCEHCTQHIQLHFQSSRINSFINAKYFRQYKGVQSFTHKRARVSKSFPFSRHSTDIELYRQLACLLLKQFYNGSCTCLLLISNQAIIPWH